MKYLSACLLAVPALAFAASVNPNAPATQWGAASGGDRLSYATQASLLCQSGNCSGLAIKACMDEVVRPPSPPGTASMTIGELAIGCIKMLKAQE